MTTALRWITRTLVALSATLGLGALSQAPYASGEAADARLRLSWRVRGTPVHECRRLAPEELARLPAHMRRAEDCAPRVLPYQLDVRIDGRLVSTELVHAAGARGDRPLYVHRELVLPPGERLVEVAFIREGQEVGEHVADALRPARLTLRARVSLEPSDVALVTYDPERQALVLRGRGTVHPGP